MPKEKEREKKRGKREKESSLVDVFGRVYSLETEIFPDQFFLNSGIFSSFFFSMQFRLEQIPSTYLKMASFYLQGAQGIPVSHYA